MNAATHLELSYRVYLKLSRQVDLMLDSMRDVFLKCDSLKDRVEFSEPGSIFLPISVDKINHYRDRGFLIFYQKNEPMLCLAQLCISISCTREEIESTLNIVASEIGDIFAGIRFVESYLTEVIGI